MGRKSGLQETDAALEKVRDSIVTNMAHELHTPLRVILASLDLAIQEKSNGRIDDLDWYLETSLSHSQKLSMLINNLVLLNDLDQEKINNKRALIDLKAHFIEPIQRVLNVYTEKKLDIHISIEPGIQASELEFAHAVSHLVDNACKFSPAGAKIWIKLEKNGKGGCSLIVQNEGSRIPAGLRQKVFGRYYQVRQQKNGYYGGLGVGLTIVRAVAEACGGSAAVLDSPAGCKVQMIYPPLPAD